ncbi:MAG: Glucose-methanol-choline (GMC) oxidoreductase:NAD binding site [uncultured Campylobacterales bacterium]|uniref:Glucose-methanol-choline (GMC) oxidoreductase:NAD binding site n=1 Tax=uncultured Campylobacterales bacterium TaxID=352960 RepID=A0A6S6SG05_9BACT|nr:MAG: Glucose-methanol-choline (GMC) oxidoreductase:NAD binding site [uncultured Campylobacterales bacterium]
MQCDVCVIGSGAGAGGIIAELSRAGKKVAVIEKGKFLKKEDFSKDEIAYTKRDIFTPNLKEEFHEIEEFYNGQWQTNTSYDLNWSLFNGNIVGGATNFMSGYFHRLRPNDFKLLSTYGKIKGANIVDWPISYEELEPYYTKIEEVVGISGKANNHKYEAPRSTKDFKYKALAEHPISNIIDKNCESLGIQTIKTPRGIISEGKDSRSSCYYSNYCGSYGCSSGAKSSSREALIEPNMKTNNITVVAESQVIKLVEENNKITEIKYIDNKNETKSLKAKVFVLSAGSIESIRLLLNSKSKNFKNGLGNNTNQVGKNVISTSGGIGSGEFNTDQIKELMTPGLFVNRSVIDWYYMKDYKGGLIDFLFEHANPMSRANSLKYDDHGNIIWGEKLQKKIFKNFTTTKRLNFETFIDWLPTDNTNVTVTEKKDKYNMPVAKLKFDMHPHDIKIAGILDEKAKLILREMGASDISSSVSQSPSPNLIAGGCRFGNDKETSVLDKNCKVHDIENLFVVDGSFMPTGGSVPYTWTIYANSFRVADFIKSNIS